jgi:1-acyl-sn-glycerol-3-phosphate acyltransferase
MIRSTLAYFFAGLYITTVSPIAMLFAWVSGDTVIIYRLARFCIRAAGWIAGVKVIIRGAERIPAEGPCFFLSNHLSNCDVPALAHALPRDFRALTKKEIMRLPVLSMILRKCSFVPVDRRDPNQARAAIDRGAALLRQGFSFLAFPEGTRSRDGHLGEFKKGVFVMAIKGQKPVVPVTVVNSDSIQPRGSYRIRRGTIQVVFHDAIPTEGMGVSDRDRLIELTRGAIAKSVP